MVCSEPCDFCCLWIWLSDISGKQLAQKNTKLDIFKWKRIFYGGIGETVEIDECLLVKKNTMEIEYCFLI